MRYFFWLAEQAIGGAMGFAWPISLPLMIWRATATLSLKRESRFFSKRLLWLAPNALMPAIVLAWATIMAHRRVHRYVRWHSDILNYLLLSAFVFACIAINVNRRSLVTLVALLLLLLTLFRVFVRYRLLDLAMGIRSSEANLTQHRIPHFPNSTELPMEIPRLRSRESFLLVFELFPK